MGIGIDGGGRGMHSGMIEAWRTAAAVGALLLLALFAPGCGGASGGGSAPAAVSVTTVNGVANLGVVTGGVVKAYRLDGGSKGALLDRYSGTGPAGQFALHITNYSGPMLLELTPDTYATFVDEYTGTKPSLTATVRSVAPAVLADQYANITPLTEIAAAGALQKLATGTDPAQGVMESLAQVGTAFLGGDNPLTRRPDDVSQMASLGTESAHYASVLAGIAGVASHRGKSIATITADFYGQLFPLAGGTGALATTDTDDLYTAMRTAPVVGVVKKQAAWRSQPLASANIAAAHGGRFQYQSLTLAASGNGLEAGSLDLYAAGPVAFYPRDLYSNGAVQTLSASTVVAASYSFASDGSWQWNQVTSAQTVPVHQGGFSSGGQVVAGVLTDNYSSTSHEWIVGVRSGLAPPSLANSDWQWVGIASSGGAWFTLSGNIGLTTSTANTGSFSGGLTPSNTKVKSTFSGRYLVDNYSYIFNIPSGSGGAVPAQFRFYPSEDGTKAVIYFADGNVWGMGVALLASTNAIKLDGAAYHYMAISVLPSSLSTAGKVALLPSGGLFQGRDFTTSPQQIVSKVPFTLRSGASAGLVSVAKGSEAVLSGYISPDGAVMVAEDPGKGIRLLLRQ
ncbi:MAG: hypothetical protein R8J84_02970 [Mariprofundales bacterium]